MCLAVPGRVVSRQPTTTAPPMAEVDFGGVRKQVCLAYIPDIEVDEYVIVHVGFAIQRLDEKSALETLANFDKLGILEEEFGDGFELAARQAGAGTVKYLEEFSDPDLAHKLLDQIHAVTTRPWAMMEVCGGQTHSIIRHGIDQLLPDGVEMIHGPGCPVCVTPLEIIDKALAIAQRPGVIFCSFGDMLRVPGSSQDLFSIKSAGGDVRVVYSPLDALKHRPVDNPDKQVVFFGIGFETTAPANAMTVYQARRKNIANFSLLVSHVLVPPAIAAIMESPSCRVQAFLAAGHVCSVMGTSEYPPLTEKYQVPIVVTGLRAARHPRGHPAHGRSSWRRGGTSCENAYPRVVPAEGNPAAMEMLRDVFEVTDRTWRGIGMIPRQRLAALAAVRRVRRRGAVLGERACTPTSRRCAAPVRCCRG